MIIDTFMFNDEFEMLDIRLAITEHYVDKWVILEGNKTWSGKDKPFYLNENFNRYKKYQDRITLITLEIPVGYKDWQCENYSRASLQQGIDQFNNNDIIIHSDLDEIINPEKWPSILEFLITNNKPVNCQLEMYVYKFDQQVNRLWAGPLVAKKHMFDNPQKLYKGSQHKRKDRSHAIVFPERVGWHWTWIGNDDRIKSKVLSCIESQYKNPEEVLDAFKSSSPELAINHKCASQYHDPEYPNTVLAVISNYPYWTHDEDQRAN